MFEIQIVKRLKRKEQIIIHKKQYILIDYNKFPKWRTTKIFEDIWIYEDTLCQ